MTIYSPQIIQEYVYDKEIFEYIIPFKFHNLYDIEVSIIYFNKSRKLILDEDYQIFPAAGNIGGNIKLIRKFENVTTLKLARILDITQELDLKLSNYINAELLEKNFDRIVMMLQQIDHQLQNTVSKAENSSSLKIESPKNKAGNVLIVGDDEESLTYFNADAVTTCGLYNKNRFIADNKIYKFKLNFTPSSANSLLVVNNKILQEPGEDFLIQDDTLIFSYIPEENSQIYVINLASSNYVNNLTSAVVNSEHLIEGLTLPNPVINQYSHHIDYPDIINNEIILNLRKACVFSINLISNVNIKIIHPPSINKNTGFKLFLNNPDKFNISWDDNIKWPYKSEFNLDEDCNTHIFTFETTDEGKVWYGILVSEH